jgi:hypothetical protein
VNDVRLALSDPIVRCLELESWQADDEKRVQDNAHCVTADGKQTEATPSK